MSGYDRELLAYKVQWEGGVTATLEYGIRSEDIDDPELALLWRRAETLWNELRPIIVEIQRELQKR